MDLIPVTDTDVIKDIITDPELFDRLRADGMDPGEFEPNIDNANLWLGIYTEDGLIGLFHIERKTITVIELHANILEKFRAKYAKDAGIMIITYFAYMIDPEVKKLVAEIPVCYPDVYHYSLNNGLVLEGKNRKSILKDGELIDQYLLGITRDEAKSHLERLI